MQGQGVEGKLARACSHTPARDDHECVLTLRCCRSTISPCWVGTISLGEGLVLRAPTQSLFLFTGDGSETESSDYVLIFGIQKYLNEVWVSIGKRRSWFLSQVDERGIQKFSGGPRNGKKDDLLTINETYHSGLGVLAT